MLYVGIAIGVVVGAGGYWLYDRWLSKTYALGKALYQKVDGDVTKAWDHIRKLA